MRRPRLSLQFLPSLQRTLTDVDAESQDWTGNAQPKPTLLVRCSVVHVVIIHMSDSWSSGIDRKVAARCRGNCREVGKGENDQHPTAAAGQTKRKDVPSVARKCG